MEIPASSIVFFNVKPFEKDLILKSFPANSVVLVPESLTKDNVSLYKNAQFISIFIDSLIDKTLLDQFVGLKFIATRSTGYDHIDVSYAQSRGVKVCNVPNYGQNTVAEHAMMLLLALAKRLPESIDRVKSGSFSPDGLTGIDLKDKVIGIIGTGNIGCNMIAMANGFGMNVLAQDAYMRKELEQKYDFAYVDLPYLAAKSDIISIHVPYCKDTHHLINRDLISKMKDGVIIINTSRGGIIETDALYDGLKSGKIGGAGLDVLEEENFIRDESDILFKNSTSNADLGVVVENHAMMNFDNVIITPHNAFNTKEALFRIIETSVANINGFIQGRTDLPFVTPHC